MTFKEIDLKKHRKEEVSSIFTNEGKFSDGRPFIEECWSEYGCTMLTIFIPSIGFKIHDEWDKDTHLEKLPNDIRSYLEKERYESKFLDKGVTVHPWGGEDKLLSINFFIGPDEEDD